jgi:diguanylate cyclase (GGDEF)-like protein
MKNYPRRQKTSKAQVEDENGIRRVFISYSHDSPDHSDAVLALADKLRHDGIDAVLDRYEPHPPFGWPYWMEDQMRKADFVLIICTERYRYYLEHLDEVEDGGKGVLWESNIIYNRLCTARLKNPTFIPILFATGSPENIPTPLKGYTYYRSETSNGYEALYRQIVGDPFIKRPPLGPRKALLRRISAVPETKSAVKVAIGSGQSGLRRSAPLVSDPLLSGGIAGAISSPGALPISGTQDAGMKKSKGRIFLTEKLGLTTSGSCSGSVHLEATLIILDLDELTQINKIFGSRVGDAVLYNVYQILSHSQADHSGRCGDDTFYATFLYVPQERTEVLAQNLCDSVRTFDWDGLAKGLRVTCSLGVAHFDKKEPTIDWPVRAAIGMRQAKEKGGNRISLGPSMLPLANGSYRVSRDLSDYYS